MNKLLAVVVCVVGYIGTTRILWFFIPQDMPLDSWGDFGFVALLMVGVFLPLWLCVTTAVRRLWKMEAVLDED